MSSFTEGQFKALALAPKFAASFSLCGSIFILCDIIRSKKKRRYVYHHIILSLSLVDLIIDVSTFLSTWPMPSDTPYVWGAAGNQQTCTAQGFFLQFAVIAPLYNCTLSLYYLLMIKHGWSERKLRRLRIPVHVCILTFGIGASVSGLFLTLYNNALLWCWQASYPPGCVESSASPTGETTCTRGDNAGTIYRWAFFYGPLWMAIFFATLAMISTWISLRRTGKKTEKRLTNSFSNKEARRLISKMQRKERDRNVAIQCLLYLGAFYLTWAPSTILRIVQSLGRSAPSFGLVLSVGICIPIQGLLNFVVYVRPRYQSYRKSHPGVDFARAIRRVSGSIFRFEANSEEDYNVAPEVNEEDESTSSIKRTADIDESKRRSEDSAMRMEEEALERAARSDD